MRAGKLDRRVSICKRIQTGTTDLNQPIYEWPVDRTVWGQIIYKRETEEFAAEQQYASRIVTFRVRFVDDVTEVDRLECDGLTYQIKGIREIGRRLYTEFATEWQS